MRIRSIKPEFWTSEDIAALDWPTRLVFIGLWSYVDDNGVGRDVDKLIVADLFPLEDDPRETLATVSRGLQRLHDGGQITRYMVDGRPFLYVNAWDDHQRIDRPNKARYPLVTCGNAVIRDTLATPSRDTRETLAPGAVEQGNRGIGEEGENTCASADAEREVEPTRSDEFERWYDAYPRKRGKGQAMKAYRAARKSVDAPTLLAAIQAQAPALMARGSEFCPYPATWLNGERWNDDTTERQQPSRVQQHLDLARQLQAEQDGILGELR